ncbi:tyrosine-type recombinase/integrase [Bradyrhizobium sp. URHC0002]
MAKARAKRIDSASVEGMTAYKLRGGGYELDIAASNGQPRTRPTFKTLELLIRCRDETAAKKSTGKFKVGMGKATFSEALDDLIERKKNEDVGKGYRDGILSIINSHLRPAFGARKLHEFADEHMEFVEVWLKHQASHHHTGADRLSFIRTVLSMAFKEAIRLRKMDAPNPVREFELQVPQLNQKEDREALTLEQMSVLVKAVLTRTESDRSELTWCTRWMMIMIGMFAGLRNEECSGLFWDCVHIEDRTIDMNRIWRDGEGIISAAKSKNGKRTIPMSPILAAAFVAYGQRLVGMERKLEGPVLICKSEIVKPEAISSQHWNAIARKAGFPDASEPGRHTFYTVGRHTCINLWRAVGIPLDTVAAMAGDKTDTIDENYKHTVSISRFKVLRKEIEARGYKGYEADDLVERLGTVLYDRLCAEGIDVGCAPPRSATPLSINSPTAPLALTNGNIIDVTPNSQLAPFEAQPTVMIRSSKQLREWQAGEVKRLWSAGWTKARISIDLGIDHNTVSAMVREIEVPEIQTGFMPRDKYQAKVKQLAILQKQHPDWAVLALAKALNVRPRWVVRHAARGGNPLRHSGPGAFKLGKHEQLIRRSFAQKKSLNQIADAINLLATSEAEKVTRTGVRWYAKNLGLTPTYEGNGVAKVDQYDADIIRMVAEGKGGKAISLTLPVSHSAVNRRIKKLGLTVTAKGTGHQLGDKHDDTIREMFAQGKDGRKIAHLLSISHSAICRRINALGLNTG